MSGSRDRGEVEKELCTTRATRVVIVDDHELLRDGLRLLIGNEPDLETIGEAEDEARAMDLIRGARPDLAIVDIALKSGNGTELVKRIKAHDPTVRVVVYSMHDERLYGERVLRAGAEGYVSKQDPARKIIDAIRHVLAGGLYFSEEFTTRVLQRARGALETLRDSPIDSLSDRELEVFRLLGQGLSTSEIASKLHVSSSTVDTYRERLKIKLNLRSSVRLVREATQWVLENP